jgi:hypothetical protein
MTSDLVDDERARSLYDLYSGDAPGAIQTVGLCMGAVNVPGEAAWISASGEEARQYEIPKRAAIVAHILTLACGLPLVTADTADAQLSTTATFADATESIDEPFGSYHALGGVEVALLPWLGVQAEYRYRWVPDSLGSGGVSAILGDDGNATVILRPVNDGNAPSDLGRYRLW